MKTIDGSHGEGGGQIFRTSLTLAMVLGVPVCVKNIRAGRNKPGLLRQHLACLNAAKAISNADVEGGNIGSQEVIFSPGKVQGGKFEFSVGTAGSTTLIFQTLLLPLLFSGKESCITLSGGTHNGMAPSYEFLALSFLPLIRAMGGDVQSHLENYGFYPVGGGIWKAEIKPVKALEPLHLNAVGETRELRAVAVSSKIPRHVAERELVQVLTNYELDEIAAEVREVRSVGPGNMLSLQRSQDGFVNVFDSFGQKNVSAEKVANKAIRMLRHFEQANVTVDEHLADQLLLPMIFGKGGSFTTTEPSQHLLTNVHVIEQFVGKRALLTKLSDRAWRVDVKGFALDLDCSAVDVGLTF